VADDLDIRARITDLIDQEHRLRAADNPEAGTEQERERLRQVEVELDQCWDLLRQRQARREFGADPGGAAVRPPNVVEGYQN
jgi:hypothetical protein